MINQAQIQARTNLELRLDGPVKRACADCSACCNEFEIPEIKKASHIVCAFLKHGACGIYGDPTRPRVCQQYVCAWAMGYGDLEDRPDKSGVIVDYRDGIADTNLYGHLIREPDNKSLETLERISNEIGLNIYLEKK